MLLPFTPHPSQENILRYDGGQFDIVQPLSHPHILSRSWEPGRTWSDAHEVHASQEALARLTSGLLHRCREHIYICLSELGESRFEQRGDFLRAFQKVLTEHGE